MRVHRTYDLLQVISSQCTEPLLVCDQKCSGSKYATNDSTTGASVREPGRTMVVVLLPLGLLLAYTCDLLLYMLEALSGFRPSKCLGLEPKWHWPLWYSKSTLPTQSCLHSTSGVPWGTWEWTSLKYEHSPSVPTDNNARDMRVVVLSQKDNSVAT